MAIIPSTCSDCGGDGDIGGVFCIECMGGGSIPVVGVNRFFKEKIKDMEDNLDALQADMDIIKPQIQALYDDLNP